MYMIHLCGLNHLKDDMLLTYWLRDGWMDGFGQEKGGQPATPGSLGTYPQPAVGNPSGRLWLP